jgi:hypothetical protein
MFKQTLQFPALLVMILTAAIGAAAQAPEDAPTVGVRYYRFTSVIDSDYKGDAKALASSLRISLDNTKGFKQVVTLDDEQIAELTKLIADSKKGSYNRQLPGNLAEAPDAYVFPNLLRVGAVERDKFARIEITYTVEMGAEAVDPVTRAILFSDKVTISEIRNKTEHRGGAKNVYEDLVSKAVDRLATKLARYFLKRGLVAAVREDAIYINLGSKHGVKPGDKFTVHKVERESSQAVGENAEEETLAEFDLDSKGTIEITEVRENAAKAKIIEKGAIQKGDAVRLVRQ